MEIEKTFNIAFLLEKIVEQHGYVSFNFEDIPRSERRAIAEEIIRRDGTVEVVEFFKEGKYDARARFKVSAKKEEMEIFETKKCGEIESMIMNLNGIKRSSVKLYYKSNPSLMGYNDHR
jgi:hypothetical protein